MKVILMLSSKVLKSARSFLRVKFGHHPTPPAPSFGAEAPTTLPAKPTRVPKVDVVGRPPSRLKRRIERHIVVGVDFGTSSTKVIWQDLTDNHFEVFHWRTTDEGSSSFLLPSTVLLRNGSMYFGFPASEANEGDVLLKSIKLCVLCRRKPTICRCGNAAARQGVIGLPGSADTIPASSFACLFLAHVFREVEGRLSARFPDDDLILIWNVGCPMDHLDIGDLRSQWEKMTGAAIELRRQVPNPAYISLLAQATRLVERLAVAVPSERNYFVQPEGLAAVKAFLESPHGESKTYAIVDVGAGTTEVSFFFNGRAMLEPGQPFRPSYLADSTDAVGGVKIDLELAQAWGCCIEEAQKRKEAGPPSIPVVQSVEDICIQYQRTCGEIVKQNKLTSAHDKRFDLFVIGGGGRLLTLRRSLQHRELPGGFVREHSQQLNPPKGLKNSANLQEHFDLLSIACGLASSLDWEYYPPSDVDSMPAMPTKPKPDLDECYPK